MCNTPLFRLLQTAQRHTKHDKFCRGPRRTGRVQRRALLKQQASVQRPAAIHGTTHTSVNCLLLTHVWHTIYQHGRVHGRAPDAPLKFIDSCPFNKILPSVIYSVNILTFFTHTAIIYPTISCIFKMSAPPLTSNTVHAPDQLVSHTSANCVLHTHRQMLHSSANCVLHT